MYPSIICILLTRKILTNGVEGPISKTELRRNFQLLFIVMSQRSMTKNLR